MKARDVMVTDVPAIPARKTIGEAIRLLRENYGDQSFINAAPGLIVENDRGDFVGMVTPLAMIEAILWKKGVSGSAATREEVSAWVEKVSTVAVESVMERQPIFVTEDALLVDVAELFIRHRFQRIPVVHGKKVIGIIYRSRLLFFMAEKYK